MTESEAIKILQRDLQIQLENKALPDGIEAIQIAIQALEQQIPKKPIFYAHDYYCSVCNSLVGNNEFEWKRFKYCDTCGKNWIVVMKNE